MVGVVGGILGDAGVNIAGMQVSRDAKGGVGAGRPLGRQRHPGRDPRRDRDVHQRDVRARRRPDLRWSGHRRGRHVFTSSLPSRDPGHVPITTTFCDWWSRPRETQDASRRARGVASDSTARTSRIPGCSTSRQGRRVPQLKKPGAPAIAAVAATGPVGRGADRRHADVSRSHQPRAAPRPPTASSSPSSGPTTSRTPSRSPTSARRRSRPPSSACSRPARPSPRPRARARATTTSTSSSSARAPTGSSWCSPSSATSATRTRGSPTTRRSTCPTRSPSRSTGRCTTRSPSPTGASTTPRCGRPTTTGRTTRTCTSTGWRSTTSASPPAATPSTVTSPSGSRCRSTRRSTAAATAASRPARRSPPARRRGP